MHNWDGIKFIIFSCYHAEVHLNDEAVLSQQEACSWLHQYTSCILSH